MKKSRPVIKSSKTTPRSSPFIVLAALACIAYAGLWPVGGFWPLLALNLVAGMAQSALILAG